MFPIVLSLITVIVGVYLIARWWAQAQPHQLVSAVRWGAIILGVGVIVFAALSRNWMTLAALAVPAIALVGRWRSLRTIQRNAKGPSKGRSSTVDTRILRMTLDHDSGAMDGEVIDGAYAGRRLSDLALGELIELWRACVADDEQSRTVLEAYLDRVHGGAWRQAAGDEASGDRARRRADSPWAQAGMSEEEAREVLGVDSQADETAIEAAYRRAMLRAHPDQGGSDWLAAKVNQARDILLNR